MSPEAESPRLSVDKAASPWIRIPISRSRPVLVLDFGAQYVQLIARRVRERHAFARIVRHDITAERVARARTRWP